MCNITSNNWWTYSGTERSQQLVCDDCGLWEHIVTRMYAHMEKNINDNRPDQQIILLSLIPTETNWWSDLLHLQFRWSSSYDLRMHVTWDQQDCLGVLTIRRTFLFLRTMKSCIFKYFKLTTSAEFSYQVSHFQYLHQEIFHGCFVSFRFDEVTIVMRSITCLYHLRKVSSLYPLRVLEQMTIIPVITL